MNWIATASSLVVAYFLAPLLVHRLGNVEYGIWVLALSTTAYLNLLDLGLRSSVVRFVSRAHAGEKHEEASQIVSSVLWVRLRIGGLTFLIASATSLIFPKVFHLPGPLWAEARLTVFIVGITISVAMPMSAIGAVLSALNRYDLQSYISLLQLVVRVVGIVLVLRRGQGLVAIAACELVASLLGNILTLWITHHIYPELRIRLRTPASEILRPLWSYGSYSFVLLVSMQLIYQADAVIVGTCISAAAVTLYSIGNSLCRYTQQLFSSLTTTFVSTASVYEASGSDLKLRALYLNGTRAVLALSFPILVTLILRAHTFISLWMGPQYSHPAGEVTQVLAIVLTLTLLNSTASSIAIGIDKHRSVAIWTLIEALFNVLLSIGFGRRFGLIGVALGTLVPSAITNLVLWPRFIPKIIQIQRFEIVRKLLIPAAVCAAPLALASFLADIHWRPMTMAGFVYQTFLLIPIFYLVFTALHWRSIKHEFYPRVKQSMFGQG